MKYQKIQNKKLTSKILLKKWLLGTPEIERAQIKHYSLEEMQIKKYLADIEIIEREALVKQCAQKLSQVNTSITKDQLNSDVYQEIKRRQEEEVSNNNRNLLNEELDIWLEPIDLAKLLDELYREIDRYIATEEHNKTAVVLWTTFTWFIDQARVAPILAVTSPVKRCGKSTLLSLITYCSRRPLSASNITPSAIFRSIEQYKPTLIIDEADTFMDKNEEMRGVINSGHTRSTATVMRSAKDRQGNFTPAEFSTWCPKVIGRIGDLPGTIEDRSIEIRLERKLNSEDKKRLGIEAEDEFKPYRQKLYRISIDYFEAFKNAEVHVSNEDDRAVDNWKPLLKIASMANEDWLNKAFESMRYITDKKSNKHESPDQSITLLKDIKSYLDTCNKSQITTQELIDYLNGLETRPWAELGKEGITPHKLSSKLKPFEIYPTQFRDHNGEKARGYKVSYFRDTFERYLSNDKISGTNGTSNKNNVL